MINDEEMKDDFLLKNLHFCIFKTQFFQNAPEIPLTTVWTQPH